MNTLPRWTVVVGVLLLGSLASADTIWIGSAPPKGQGLKLANVKIMRIENGNLVFQSSGGAVTTRELSRVAKIVLDDNDTFNKAEDLFVEEKWEKAADAYSKILSSGAKDWIKTRATQQLIKSASQSGRFDLETTGWTLSVLASKEPENIARPAMPPADSKYLDMASARIQSALNTAGITEPQRTAMLFFLLDIYTAKNDTAQRTKILAALEQAMSRPGSNVPPTVRMELVLSGARAALADKKYDKVLADIEANRTLITDPMQQATALYFVAEAKNGLASDKDDPTALKDVALAYMTVVAHFKDLPDRPAFVAESLLKVGQIHERLKEPQTAMAVYKQVQDQYPNTPSAKQAAARIQELKKNAG